MRFKLSGKAKPLHSCALATSLLLTTMALGQESTHRLRIEREIFILEGRSHSLAWSPDGSTLACGGTEGEVTLIAYPSGRLLHTLEASDHWIGKLVFSPDSSKLAVSGRDLSMWHVEDGTLLGRFPSSSVGAMDWSRDGSVLACMGPNEKGIHAVLLRPDTLTELRSIPLGGKTAIDALALNQDGSRLAVGRRSGVELVFDTSSGNRLSIKKTGEWVHDLCFLNNGELMRLGWKGNHRLFGGRRQKFGEHSYSFRAQPDGSRVIIRSNDSIGIFRPNAKPSILKGSGPVALHPDGVHWARGYLGHVEIFADERRLESFPAGSRLWPRNVVLAENGRIIVATDSSSLYLFDAETGSPLSAKGLPKRVALIPNPSGPHLVLHQGSFENGSLEYWRLLPDGHQLEFKVQVPHSFRSKPVLSKSGRLLGLGTNIVHRTKNARVIEIDELMLDSLIPSPSGNVLAGRGSLWSCFAGVGALSSDLYLYSPEGKKLFHRKLKFGIYDVAFRPDGEEIAVATEGDLLIFDRALRPLWSRSESWSHMEWLDSGTLLGTSSPNWSNFLLDPRRGLPTLELLREGQEEPIDSLVLDDYPGAPALDREAGRVVLTLGDRMVVVRIDS